MLAQKVMQRKVMIILYLTNQEKNEHSSEAKNNIGLDANSYYEQAENIRTKATGMGGIEIV